LSCGSDKKIKLWNPVSGLLLKTYGGHADEVTDASVHIIHIEQMGFLIIYILFIFQGSCDSSYIVSASLDKSIIYWDVSTGKIKHFNYLVF